jgi:hypothetical protein
MTIQSRIHKLRTSDKIYFYLVGMVGLFVGMKTCDFFYYSENALLKEREKMEEEFWKEHG